MCVSHEECVFFLGCVCGEKVFRRGCMCSDFHEGSVCLCLSRNMEGWMGIEVNSCVSVVVIGMLCVWRNRLHVF